MIDFKGKNIAVLGWGIEGQSSAAFLLKKGAKATVLDKKEEKDLPQETIEQFSNGTIKIVVGKDYLNNLDQYDIIIRSPGILRNIPQILDAEKKGVIITSQTKLFFDLCPGKIIGVTGTKGKGTTSALIYEMLKREGKDVYLGGNIGKPTFDFLDTLTPQSWVVLELSSFQLQDLTKSPASPDEQASRGWPHIAVVLMITQEHLAQDKGIGKEENYHVDVADYVNAKRNILRFQKPEDFAVINRDYIASHESDIHAEGRVFQVSRERECEQGCFVKDGKIVIRISNFKFQISNKLKNEKINGKWKMENGKFEIEIIDVKNIFLPGKHNWENVCAAAMAATLAGVSRENIKYVLHTFKGLEHRLEFVREIGGVRYYDDSFSTTPETAIAAINAFSNPEILILGGAHKGSDFTELGAVINSAKNIKAIIGIGVEWPKIKFKIQSSKFKVTNTSDGGSPEPVEGHDSSEVGEKGIMIIEGAKDMKTIVQASAKIAKPGDVVLLSPACSSFDMFKNYKERGSQFKREVLSLP